MNLNRLLYPDLPPTVMKFITAGIINTSVFYLTFIFLIHLEINYLVASACGYLLATGISYALNKIWTFKSLNPSTIKMVILFVIINLLSLGGNLSILYFFVDFLLLNLYFSQLIALFSSMAINYFGYKKLFS